MFRKYTSIENADPDGYLGKLRAQLLDHGAWVVQEKAHGANLSFRTDDGEHWVSAKRTSVLAPDERFYSHQSLLAAHLARLRRLYALVRERVPDMPGPLIVFGEVVGGDYPGTELREYPRVQRGVYYAPDHHFYAFDILVGGRDYLPVPEANALFETCDFAYAKTCFGGSLAECLAYPNDFDSTLPALFGYENLRDNIAEGTVIRPTDGRRDRSGNRVLLKYKNAKWAEKAARKRRAERAAYVMPEAVREVVEVATRYVTPARVAGVAGNLGQLTRRDYGRLLGAAAKDAHADFVKDHPGVLDALTSAEKKAVTKALSSATAQAVRAYFQGVER